MDDVVVGGVRRQSRDANPPGLYHSNRFRQSQPQREAGFHIARIENNYQLPSASFPSAQLPHTQLAGLTTEEITSDPLAHLRPSQYDAVFGGYWNALKPLTKPNLNFAEQPTNAVPQPAMVATTQGGKRPVVMETRPAPIPPSRARKTTRVHSTTSDDEGRTRSPAPNTTYDHLCSATRAVRPYQSTPLVHPHPPCTVARYAHARAPKSPVYEYISPGGVSQVQLPPSSATSQQQPARHRSNPPPPPRASFSAKIDALDPDPVSYDYADSVGTPVQPSIADLGASVLASGTDPAHHLCLDDISELSA